jgi:hypothetical protein
VLIYVFKNLLMLFVSMIKCLVNRECLLMNMLCLVKPDGPVCLAKLNVPICQTGCSDFHR